MKDESSTSGGGGVSTAPTAPSPSRTNKHLQDPTTIRPSSSSSSSSTCSGGSKSSSPSWSSSLESSNGGSSSGSSSKSGSGGSTSPVTGVTDQEDQATGGGRMREVILQKLMATPLDNEDDLVDFAQWVTTVVGRRLSRKRLVHPDEAAVETTSAVKRLKTSSVAAAASAAAASSPASSSSPSSSSSSSSSSSHSHSKAHDGDGQTAAAIENNHNGTGSPRFHRTMTTGGPGAGGGLKRTASPTLNHHQGSALDRDRDTEVINILLEFSNKASKAKHDHGDDMQTSDSNRSSPRRNNHHHHHKHHHTHHHCHHGPTQKVAAAGVPLFKNLSMNGYHKASSGPPLLARTHSEAERLPSHDACDHPMSVSSLSSGGDQSPPESSTTTSGSTVKGSGFSSSSSSSSSSSAMKGDGHSSSSGGITSQECSSNSSKDKDSSSSSSSSSGNGNSSDTSSNSDGGDGGSSSSQSDVCSSSSSSGSSKGGHSSSSSNNGHLTAPAPVIISSNERERERDRERERHHHHHHRLREGVMPPLPPLPLTRSTGSVIPDPSLPPAIKPHTLHKGEEGSTITVDVDGRFLGVIVAKISKHYIYYMERGSPFKEGRPAGKWTYFYGASEKGSGRKHLFAGQRFKFSADPSDKRIIAGVVRYNKDTARNAALMYDVAQSEFYLMSIAGIQRSAVEEFLEDPAEITDLRDKTIRWITSPARDKDSFPRFASRAQTSSSSPSTNGASSNGNGNEKHNSSIGSTSSSGSSTASSSPLHGSSGRSRPSAATNDGLRVRSLSTGAIPLAGGQVPHGPPQYPAMPPTGLLHHGAPMGLLGLEEAAYLHGPPGTPYVYDYHHAARMAMRPMVAREVDMDAQDAYHSHSLALAAAASGGAASNQGIHGSSSFPSAKASAGQPHYRIPVGLVNGSSMHATTIPVPSSSGIPNSATNMPPSSSAPATTEPASYAAAHATIPTLAYHPGAWMGPHIPLPSSLYAPRTHSAIPVRHNLQTRGWQAEAANKSTVMPTTRKGQSATSLFPS